MKIANEKVYNRGTAPQEFLDELVRVLRQAPIEIFSTTYGSLKEPDVFEFLADNIPWVPSPVSRMTDPERRALMCELLRVLGGFESSWDWTKGRDTTNPESFTPCTSEAGLWQCSGDSMNFDGSLVDCFMEHYKDQSWREFLGNQGRDERCEDFQNLTKESSPFAIEYVCRLLRFTVRHHGPLKRGEVFPWLREAGYKEFLTAMGVPSAPVVVPPEPTPDKIVVVLDPGHGDHDSGAIGYFEEKFREPLKFLEKDINLKVSNSLLELMFHDPRFEVRATRQTDIFLSLGGRSDVANGVNANLFLSIHANSGGGTGHEVYTSRGQTASDLVATALFNRYSKEFPEFRGRVALEDGDPDKEAGFSVLTRTKGSAVLYELGFMDNQEDLFAMIQSNFAFRAARALYMGILDAFGLGLPLVEEPEVPEDPEVPEPLPPSEMSMEDREKAADWLIKRAEEKEAQLPALLGSFVPGDFYLKCREAAACRDAANTLKNLVV